MALIHTVESLKNTALMFGRDTNAGISDRKNSIVIFLFEINRNLTAFFIVSNRIVAKVIDDFVKVSANTVHNAGFSVKL